MFLFRTCRFSRDGLNKLNGLESSMFKYRPNGRTIYQVQSRTDTLPAFPTYSKCYYVYPVLKEYSEM